MNNVRKSLGVKFSVLIALMSLVMGFLIIFIGYQLYYQQNIEEYSARGNALVRATAEVIDWDKIAYYAESLETDAAYDKTLEEMRTLARSGGVEYLYVLRPYDDDGAIYIFDTDESEDRLELGDYTNWEGEFEHNTDALLRGEDVDPFISESEWGQLLSIYVPFNDSTGDFAGYLGVDYPADLLVKEQNRYILSLSIAAVIIAIIVTLVFLFILRLLVLKPIDKIVEAAESYSIDESEGKTTTSSSIKNLKIDTRDELQTLDKSLKYLDSTIEEYIENLEHAERRAETDAMTGLLNRESFKDYVTMLIKKEPHSTNAFMMIDLDEFKTINDTYGHLAGDEVIEAAVNEIRLMFRSTDLVARMGGDEFAVFCRGPITKENVEKRATQLVEAIREVRVKDKISFTVSLGAIYFNSKDVYSYQALYMQADVALYEAKENGRNRFVLKDYEDVDNETMPTENKSKDTD